MGAKEGDQWIGELYTAIPQYRNTAMRGFLRMRTKLTAELLVLYSEVSLFSPRENGETFPNGSEKRAGPYRVLVEEVDRDESGLGFQGQLHEPQSENTPRQEVLNVGRGVHYHEGLVSM